MRHGTSSRRQRGGRGNNNGGRRGNNSGQKRSQVYDSNGPDVRIRGTAHQVFEKYLTLSKDCSAAGDMILAESYMQHAEHYQRIINSWVEENKPREQSAQAQPEQKAKADDAGNTKETAPAKAKDGDAELALPSSILGGEVNADDATRTAQLSEA